MFRVTIAALAATSILTQTPARAEEAHTWYGLYVATAECKLAPASPFGVYNSALAGEMPGLVIEKIAPADVKHYSDGNLAVQLRGTFNGKETWLYFFTSKSDCEQTLRDHHITAQQAPEGDIN